MGWNYWSISTLQRFNRWSLKLDDKFHPTLCWPGDYPSMLRLKLNHVRKRDSRPLLDNSLTSAAGWHCSDVIMGSMAFHITSLTIVYSTVYSSADQRKHQRLASLAFCEGTSPLTGEFPTQIASNAENVSIWWRHHVEVSNKWHETDLCHQQTIIVSIHFLFETEHLCKITLKKRSQCTTEAVTIENL